MDLHNLERIRFADVHVLAETMGGLAGWATTLEDSIAAIPVLSLPLRGRSQNTFQVPDYLDV